MANSEEYTVKVAKRELARYLLERGQIISSRGSALLDGLIQHANSCGWPDVMSITNSHMETTFGHSLPTLDKYRRELIDLGLIIFTRGRKHVPNKYSLNPAVFVSAPFRALCRADDAYDYAAGRKTQGRKSGNATARAKAKSRGKDKSLSGNKRCADCAADFSLCKAI